MAICRPEAIDAAPVHGPEQSGGWRRDDFLASRGMGEAQGKKVEPPPLRLRRSRRSRPLARSAKREAVGRAPNSILGRSRGQPEGTCARARAPRAKRRRPWRRKRTASSEPNRSQSSAPHRLTVGRVGGRIEAIIEGCCLPSVRDKRSPPILANLFDDWERRGRQCLWSCSRSSTGE